MGATGRLRSPDVMRSLLSEPCDFDYVQAMEALETSDSQGRRFGEGLDKAVRLKPNENLVFPASDIAGCQRNGDQSLTLLMSFLGLYGVDAPLPQYLLDRTTANDDDAARMRAFLDVFNQRFYVLLYRAMQVARPAAGELPRAFRGCAGAMAGHLDALNGRRRFPLGKVRTAAGLREVLQDQFPEVPVEVVDRRPAWERLGEKQVLGSRSCRLGDSTILGGRAYVANGAVAIRLGPVNADLAQQLLPGTAKGNAFQTCIDHYLSGQVGSELHIRVKPSIKAASGLGQDGLRLGWSLWLGEQLQEEYLIRVKGAPSDQHSQL